jgi:aryl-alcohol dehydrogenase-like predicted oxidoreductase
VNYRRVGKSGLRVSEIGLGTWLGIGARLDPATSRACVRAALDCGINLFDTADVYAGGAAERALGELLADEPRASIVLASKCFFPRSDDPNDRGLSRKHIVASVERSLRNLRTEHLDLMQCHRFDPEVPLEETVRAMDDLVRQGKILYWGIGRFDAAQAAETVRVAHLQPIADELGMSTLLRSPGVFASPRSRASSPGPPARSTCGRTPGRVAHGSPPTS